ncbi:MAG: phage recombination protein Bet [Clostridia bacterium]|jgi:phage recombination protein Bet|nr:phage recombination protein Bet [Clostridia bacterium]
MEKVETKTENKKELTTQNKEIVSYKMGDGSNVQLTESAIRNLTNNNEFITQGEIQLFIEMCKYQKLNPFLKELQMVKYDNSKPCQMITSIGAFMRIAEEHPKYEGIEDGIIVQTADGKIVDRVGCVLYPKETLIGGWAKVYRSDRRIPTIARLALKEYSKSQSTWNTLSSTMINKCAKVSAIRKAFPKALNGLYEEDEIKNSNVIENASEEKVNVANQIYDIDDTVVDDVIVETCQDIETPTVEQGDIESDFLCSEPIVNDPSSFNPTNIIVIDYNDYKNNLDKYIKVNNEDGKSSYDPTTRTIKVKLK